MQIILLRHGTRERDADPERDEFREIGLPLKSTGEAEAKSLAGQLQTKQYRPAFLFTSPFRHSRQTAEIVRDVLGGRPAPEVVEMFSLSPHYQGPRRYREWPRKWEGSLLLETIAKEAKYAGHDFVTLDTIVLFMHKPRLEQVAATITSADQAAFESLGFAEGVCLAADSLEAFLEGHGREVERFSR